MENKFLIFRADGNANTGLGHLYRIFALIEMFKSGFKFQLVVRDASILSVIPKDYNLRVISSAIKVSEEPKWFEENYVCKAFLENKMIYGAGLMRFQSGKSLPWFVLLGREIIKSA